MALRFCNKFKHHHHRFRVGHIFNDWCPYKRKEKDIRDIDTQGRKQCEDKGRDGSNTLQAKECRGLPAVSRS